MKLLYTQRSPYARKVRVVAIEKQIPLELIAEDLTKKSVQLLEANPLGKIPALILDNGNIVVDSPVICEYLEQWKPSPMLISQDLNLRFKILSLAAIADGLMDVAVAAYLEKTRHPQDFDQKFITAQENTIQRTLEFFDQCVKDLENLSLASIAVAVAKGYVDFRFAHLKGQVTYPKFQKWYEKFSMRPSMASTIPQQ